jgi:hypothetical protein
VGPQLESLGARYLGKVGDGHQWLRPKSFSFRTATCRIVDDTPPNPVAPDPRVPPPPDARVVAVEYLEGWDLL